MPISKDTVSIIEQELIAKFGTEFERIYLELQDDSELLFIQLTLKCGVSGDRIEKILSDMRSFVEPLVPARREGYSWMATIVRDKDVIGVRVSGSVALKPFDPAGNITSIADHMAGSRSQAFTYDNLNRLASASGL
ncbi:MAG: RHS repeat domain-containing protein [Rhizomicrobium sp.]